MKDKGKARPEETKINYLNGEAEGGVIISRLRTTTVIKYFRNLEN